jgi:hypothetical protein
LLVGGIVVGILQPLTSIISESQNVLIMKNVLLGCAVLLSVAVVLATKNENKMARANRHSATISAYNFANDTIPKKDTTKPKKDTMRLANQ